MMFNTGDLILDAVILSIVARTPEGTYGYKITQDVRSKMDVPESTFYPLLKQMEIDGYLEVYHKDIGGRSRRFYKITEFGIDHLAFCQQNWTNYLQNASALLMSAPVENPVPVQPEAPVQTVQPQPSTVDVQPEVPVQMVQPQPSTVNVQPEAPVQNTPPQPKAFSISTDGFSQTGTSFEFTINNEEPEMDESIIKEESDLFELETNSGINGKSSISIDDIPTADPAEEVSYENKPSQFAQTEVLATEAVSEVSEGDDEADFLAEMAMGELEEDYEEETVQYAEEVQEASASNETELESLLSQLRSFESKMSAHNEYVAQNNQNENENINKSAVNITDLQGVSALLNTPAPAPSEEPAVIPAVKPAEVPTPVQNTTVPAEDNLKFKEVRNPETDESVNSLVDLLKNEPDKKSSFFKNRVAKASNILINKIAETVESSSVPKATPTIENKPELKPVTPKIEVVNPVKYEEVRNPETDESVNSLVDLLKNDTPAPKARFFAPKAPKEKSPVAPKPMKETATAEVKKVNTAPVIENTHKIKLTEVRNPETDHAVNSLVELLCDDTTDTKPKLFRSWSAKSSSSAPSELKVKKTPVVPVAQESVKKVSTVQGPVHEIELSEVRNPETDDAVNSLVDLLRNDSVEAKPSLFRPRASKAKAPVMKSTPLPASSTVEYKKDSIPVVSKKDPIPVVPVKKVEPVVHEAKKAKSIPEQSADSSVDTLVELLTGNKQEKSSVFSKAKPYVAKSAIPGIPKVSAPKAPKTVAQATESSPASENKPLIKPEMTAKTFEAKAASPNARSVETRATITKPLEAKAISTNPTAAKATESKSVETKAVVTPKEEIKTETTVAGAQTEHKQENELPPVDSFKYRLMQANLLPDQDK